MRWLTGAVLTMMCAAGPIASAGPDYANVAYAPHERNVLDFYRAASAKPTPVVVFLHGGGFVQGSKDQLNAAMRDRLLQAGISVAAVNYRYATQASFPAPMMDGVRAIQFLRWKASEWNIDSRRIGAMGGSAGACMALWIGYHDDFARPGASDPVERESSRLAVMAVAGAQTTLELDVIEKLIAPSAARHPSGPAFFGVPFSESGSERARKIYRAASPAAYLSKDDPPAWLYYSDPDVNIPADAKAGTGIHHPRFGHYLRERCAPLGLVCEVREAKDFQDTKGAALEQFEFLRSHLTQSR